MRWLALALIIGALCGCVHPSVKGEVPTVLVQTSPPTPGIETVALTGALDGRLIARDGCFFVRSRSGYATDEVQIVWSSHFRLIREGERVGVLNTLTGEKAFAGDWIQAGGGLVDALHEGIQQRDLAQNCGGPWVGVHTARVGTPP